MTTKASRQTPTMADLAALAGVSKITVSRALRDSPSVRPAMRKAIQDLAVQLGYRLNVTARNLRLKRTRTVVVVIEMVPSAERPMSEPYPLALLGGISQELTRANYNILLTAQHPLNPEALQAADGAILLGQGPHEDSIRQIRHLGVPFVVWGAVHDNQGYVVVGSNNRDGGRQAAARLLSVGRRRLVYLGDVTHPEIAERFAGFRDALAESNIVPILYQDCPFNFAGGAMAVAALLASDHPPFDGVFACSDLIAMGAIRALVDAHIGVPQDVSVVGFDDTPMASYFVPPLTTIQQDWQEGGKLLARKILALIETGQAHSEQLPIHAVIRQT